MSYLHMLHANLVKTGLAKDTIAASRILNFCAFSPASDINYAYSVFSRIRQPNLFSWNTIIRGFSQSSTPQNAISLFIEMLHSSVIEPNRLTYPSLFKAYAQLGLANDGAQLHGRILKLGLESDSFIQNTIIFMYANCGYLVEANRLFDENSDTGFDVVAWNSMVMGLAKSGQVDESRRLFDKMQSRNTITWNSMISGYVRNGRLKEAFDLFYLMKSQKFLPTEFTMVSLLNACGNLGALEQGEWIYAYIRKSRIEVNSIVLTAIIDMYCKCGSIEKAIRVFNDAPKKVLSTWNSMIIGLAINGRGKDAIECFSRLQSSGLKPDDVSFLGVLTACNHCGMVEEGREYFWLMNKTCKMKTAIKHYSCMVDILGRAGYLEEAQELIANMPEEPDAIIWASLLSACRKHGDVNMAKRAADQLLELSPSESCTYVLLSNTYGSSARFEDAMNTRLLMQKRGLQKEPGCSLIEVNGEVHEFVASGILHSQVVEIHALLDELSLMLKEIEHGRHDTSNFLDPEPE
ncbi:hypothetical protein Scep_011960 [Stephania cephalantha]|uniref:Pentatricopeptide repeat-containing protein n=1 Tax=Stephania cephalantha TaxID=152367 RepID=A0AAP0JE92_9MAGN